MNVNDFINRGGIIEVPNPKYDKNKKKNKEPQFIKKLDDGTSQDQIDRATLYDLENRQYADSKDVDKYSEYGLTWNPYRNMDVALADAQSNWEKAFNALGQTVVSEVSLGTVQVFSDIFDYVASNILHITKADYQNPVSETIKAWQDKFNEEIAPIYANPELNIQNGGLKDFGWWMKSAPQIASTLTLLLPTKMISGLLGLLAKTKLGRVAKVGTRNARRWATNMRKVESAEQLKSWQLALNNPTNLRKMNYGAKTVAEGLLMRTMENYQEAGDVHVQTYENALNTLNGMSDEKLQYFVDSNSQLKQELQDNKIAENDKDGIAKHIAKKAADRTFAMDFSNAIFDIIQLHSLNNIGAGIKKATGRAVNRAQKESIRAAEEIVTGKAPEVAKSGFLKKVGEGITDFVKYNGKTILAESTESIEEAVNYIAQQEGLTYGKMLLEGKDDNYDKKWYAPNAYSAWSNMQGALSEYIKSPELQESAFWGFMGGLVFKGVGDVTNKASLALNEKAERKKAEKLAERTGEKINTPGESFFDLFQSEETKVARLAIAKRQARLNQLKADLKTIQDGYNIYDRDKDNKPRQFTGDIETEQEITKARLLNEYKSKLAIDAINSGTFDLLTDYYQSDEVKKAMVTLGLADESTIDAETENTLKVFNNVKDIYSKQSTFILNQLAAINAERGEGTSWKDRLKDAWNKEDIPLEYANMIAESNVNTLLNIASVNDEIASVEELARQQEALLSAQNNSDSFKGAKDVIATQALIDLYQRLDAKQRYLQEMQTDDALVNISNAASIKYLENQKKNVLRKLSNANTLTSSHPVVNIYNAILGSKARSYYRDASGVEQDVFDDKFDFSQVDANVVAQAKKIFDELTGKDISPEARNTGETMTDDDVHQLANVFNDSADYYLDKKRDRSLAQQNSALAGHYITLAYLNAQKSALEGEMITSLQDVKNSVEYHHNILNEARIQAVQKASAIILKAYQQYEGVSDNNGQPLIEAIIEAYKGNKQKAREIAESAMTDEGDFITSEEFLDALDIFNFNSRTNDSILEFLHQGIELAQSHIAQQRNVDNLDFTENSNYDTATNDSESTSSSAPTTQAQDEPQNRSDAAVSPQDSRQKTSVKVIFNDKGQIASIKGNSNRTDAIGYINKDGSVELDIASLLANDQLRYIRDRKMFNVDDDVDFTAGNNSWQVRQNPILVQTKTGYNVEIKGIISSTTTTRYDVAEYDTTEEADDFSEDEDVNSFDVPEGEIPIIDFESETAQEEPAAAPENATEEPDSAAPEEASQPSSPVEGEQSAGNSPIAVGDRVKNGGGRTGVVTAVDDKYVTVKLDNTGEEKTWLRELTTKLSSGTTQSNLPTGEQRKPSYNAEQAKEAVTNEFGNIIGSRTLAPDLNLDEVAAKVMEELLADEQFSGISYDEMSKLVEAKKAEIAKARAMFANMTGLAQSAATTAFAGRDARVEETGEISSNAMFFSSVKTFLDEYSKIIVVPKIDGKKVVRLSDILRILNNVYATSDNSIAIHMYEIVKAYLELHSDEYFVKDLNQGRKVLENIGKTTQDLIDETNLDGEFSVDIETYMELVETMSPEEQDKFYQALGSIQQGDSLTVSARENELVILKGDVEIGRLPRVAFNNGVYRQTNNGWNDDVTVDANGNIISRSKDVITDLLCSDNVDSDALRTLLEKIVTQGEGKVTKVDVAAFIKLAPIASLITKSIQSKKDKSNILFVGKNNKIDADRVLTQLVNIWRYANETNVSDTKAERLEDTKLSISAWYGKLYKTYRTVNAIDKDVDVVVKKVNIGQFTRVKNDGATYTECNFPSKGLDMNLDAKISCVVPGHREIMSVSGKGTRNNTSFYPGSTFLTIFTNSTNPEYVKAYGRRFVNEGKYDFLDNEVFKKIASAAVGELRRALNKVNTSNNVGHMQEVVDVVTSILRCKDFYDRIPLYSPIATGGSFEIEQIKVKDKLASGITINYYDGKRYRRRFRIFEVDYRGAKNLGFSMVTEDEAKKGQTFDSDIAPTFKDKNNPDKIVNDIANAFITNILGSICQVNISAKGIESDAKASTNYGGFINRKDGKTVIEIGGKVIHEADSYNDCLVKNDLIKINAQKNENGSNFTPKGNRQFMNQYLSISLPKVETARQPESTNTGDSSVSLTSNDVLEPTSDKSSYAALKGIIQQNDASSIGRQLVDQILGNDFFEDKPDITEEDIDFLSSILPTRLLYDPEFNAFVDGKYKGSVAKTRIGNRRSNYALWSKDGKNTNRKRAIPTNIDTIVGLHWMNMASSNNWFRRGAAIRTLIHERLHTEIHKLSDAKRKEIFDAVEQIYDVYLERLNKDLAITDKSNDRFKYKAIAEQTKASLSGYTRSNPNAREILLEEFLVESLTNSNFFNYLNSIKTEDTDNGKKDNLFTKIAKLIAKIFGFDIKDNSLYMRQLNTLRDIFDETGTSEEATAESSEEAEQAAESTPTEPAPETPTEQEGQTEPETPVEPEQSIEEDNGLEDSLSLIHEANPEADTSDEASFEPENGDEVIYEDDYEAASEEDDELSEDDVANQNIEEINAISNSFTNIQNLDSFRQSLPLADQTQFDALMANGLIEFKCK